MNFDEVLNEYKNRTILITGGAGCIGSSLVRVLLPIGNAQIVVLDDFSSSYRWNLPRHALLEVVDGSILDEQKLKQVFYKKPDYIFHLASHFANQNSIDHPETDLMANGLGLLKVLEYSRLVKPRRFVFAGSGCSVYGSHAQIPFKEEAITLTLDTPYQIHKLLGELYCNHYNTIYDLPTAIGRFFNVYGPGEVPGRYRNVIPNFTWMAMHGKPLTITGTGDETRDFAYVDDIVDGILRLGVIDEAIGQATNLASATETSVKELAALINDVTGNGAGIAYSPKREWDKSNRRLASIDKARRILGYEPKTEFKTGLENVHNWLVEHKDLIEHSLGPQDRLW